MCREIQGNTTWKSVDRSVKFSVRSTELLSKFMPLQWIFFRWTSRTHSLNVRWICIDIQSIFTVKLMVSTIHSVGSVSFPSHAHAPDKCGKAPIPKASGPGPTTNMWACRERHTWHRLKHYRVPKPDSEWHYTQPLLHELRVLRGQENDTGRRCSVGNPGISYSDLLILIPGSRVISIWFFYAIHITKA